MDSNPKNSKPYVGEPKPWNEKHHIFALKNLMYILFIDCLITLNFLRLQHLLRKLKSCVREHACIFCSKWGTLFFQIVLVIEPGV